MGEPKIGGSFGGFIALVVGLILFIIACTTATIILLRQEAAERDRIRQRNAAHSLSSYNFRSSLPPKSWISSLRGMFVGNRRKARAGWIQAGSGDDWDDDLSPDERLRSMTGNTRYTAHPTPLDRPFHPPEIPHHATSTVGYGPRALHADDINIPNRFASLSEHPIPITPPSHSVDVSVLPRSASPESMSSISHSSVHFEQENRKNSVQSDISTRTFGSGSKFIEGLT